MEKKRNLWVIPTDKPSRLYLTTKEYIFEKEYSLSTDECQNKHIYITNDEEIKKEDWAYNTYTKSIHIIDIVGTKNNQWKKIILSTDVDLIKDGVQAIDDDFLEWFVKNTSCEYAEVERIFLGNSFVHIGKTPSKKERLHGCYNNGKQLVGKWEELFTYKIIITQEESNRTHYLDELPNMDKKILAKMWEDAMPKLEPKQETLEEAAENYIKELDVQHYISQEDFILGAKWQSERMYSEEEVRDLLQKALTHQDDGETGSLVTAQGKIRTANFFSWFEQNKKK